MRADIHDGQEHKSSIQGPDTEAQGQSSPSVTAGPYSWSGGIEARIGLRMMPTFPRSPLSFRTAGFPQYGWKAGLSGDAFPDGTQLKSAPDIRCMSAGLHSPFVPLVITAIFPL
jgi:hypothetical protein